MDKEISSLLKLIENDEALIASSERSSLHRIGVSARHAILMCPDYANSRKDI